MRHRRAVIPVAAALIAVLVAASVLRVRQGDLAVVSWRGGGTPDLRLPGVSLRVPLLQRVQVYPRGSVIVRATLSAASREGSALDLPYTVKAQPDPQTLLQLHRDGGDGGATAAVRVIVEEQLRKAAAATCTYDLASGAAIAAIASSAERALDERLGPGLELSLERPILPAGVRASVERAAIYRRRLETGARVVLVGIDAGDSDIIDPLGAPVRGPYLARLKREGAWV